MYYSINVPLTDGITDETYEQIFRPLMTAIMERYQPGALVVQCGMCVGVGVGVLLCVICN